MTLNPALQKLIASSATKYSTKLADKRLALALGKEAEKLGRRANSLRRQADALDHARALLHGEADELDPID